MDDEFHPQETPRIAGRLNTFGVDYIKKPSRFRVNFVELFILFSHPIEERKLEINEIVQPSVDYVKNMIIID